MKLFIFILCVAAVFSAPLLPNINDMNRGYDSLKGQPVMESLTKEVWNFTYNDNKIFRVNGQRFKIPDQLNLINDPSAASTSTNEVFMTSFDIQTTLFESYSGGIGGLFLPGMFSTSEQTMTFNEHYYKYEQFVATSYLKITTWKATLDQKARPLTSFLEAVESLPSEYNSLTCPQFKQFFSKYGTHSFDGIIFGGTVTMSTSFSIEITKTKSVTEIQQDLNTQFFLMTLNEQLTSVQEQELDTLNAIYTSTFDLIGGNPGYYNQTQWQTWANTVPNNPVFVELIQIPHWKFSSANALENSGNRDISRCISTLSANALEKATTAYLLSQSNYWQVIDKTPITYSYPSTTANNNTVYSIDYFNDSNEPKGFYSFSLQTNKWQTLTTPPSGAKASSLALVDNYVYAIGYIENSSPIYRFHNNEWIQTGQLPIGLGGISIVNMKDGFLMIGGFWCKEEMCGSSAIISFYNATDNTVYPFATMPNARSAAASVLINGSLYLFGGYDLVMHKSNSAVSQVDIYHIKSKTWTVGTPMADPKLFSTAVVMKDEIYVIGGANHKKQENTVYIYNPLTAVWTTGSNTVVPKVGASVVVVDTAIYAVGMGVTEVIVTQAFC